MHISQFFCIFARLFGKKYDKTMFTPINAHIEIDRVLKRARKDGKDIHLTSLEFGLLEYLCSHPNKLCSRDELIDQVWGERFLYDPGTIDVHLSAFLTTWLANHEAEIRDAGLTPQLRLTPFVNQITISPEALRRMLDSILAALLPTAQAGYLKLSSRLTMQSFILALEINGTISELIVPIQA